MERLTLNTKDIQLFENNYKYMDVVLFIKLKQSLQNYGQLKPLNCIKLNDTYYCFEGKNILKAMMELNIEKVEINVFDEKDANEIQLIINETYFRKCDVWLSEKLNQMTEINYAILPFEKEEVNNYIKLLKFNWDDFERKTETENQISLFDLGEEEFNEEQKDETLLINIIDTKGTENILQTKEMPEIIEQQKREILLPSEQRKLDAQKIAIIEPVVEEKPIEQIAQPIVSENIIIQIPVLIEINNFTTQTKYIPSNLEYKFKELFGDRKVTPDEYDNFMVDNLEMQNPNQKSLF